jgi:hypothetical protein
MLFAYLGPETMLPLTSIFGVVFGMVLMFWHKILGFVRGAFRRVWPTAKQPDPPAAPLIVNDSSTRSALGEEAVINIGRETAD